MNKNYIQIFDLTKHLRSDEMRGKGVEVAKKLSDQPKEAGTVTFSDGEFDRK
jgi:hypothetical protein